MNKETAIQNEILLALSENGILCMRQMVGKFRPIYSPNTVVNIGIPGMADIGAIVPVTVTPDMVGRTIGVALQLEVKTATGVQAKNQKLWELAVKNRGGFYGLARSPESALKIIQGMQK